MKFFTGKGDNGESSLINNGRKLKSSIEFEFIGTLDEVTAFIGLVISTCEDKNLSKTLGVIQQDLYDIMVIVSDPSGRYARKMAMDQAVKKIERFIQFFGEGLEYPKQFIFSGTSKAGAYLDVVRTVTRRAERIGVRCASGNESIDKNILAYLNRLSSLFYVMRLHVEMKSEF